MVVSQRTVIGHLGLIVLLVSVNSPKRDENIKQAKKRTKD